MTDVYDVEKRSQVMRRIKASKNKSTELRLIEIFQQNGISGWKRNYQVIGHPDFVFLKQRVAVFVDGCFWHGHDCRNTKPKQNAEYWERKITRNKEHDAEISSRFLSRGWHVLRIWECELKNSNRHILIERFRSVGIIGPSESSERKEI